MASDWTVTCTPAHLAGCVLEGHLPQDQAQRFSHCPETPAHLPFWHLFGQCGPGGHSSRRETGLESRPRPPPPICPISL